MSAITSSGIRLASGEERPLFAGAMHYFRQSPSTWRTDLQRLADLGLTAVGTCVPWSLHETGRGRFRFDGDLDLRRFVETAGEVGLMVLLGVGPRVHAELNGGGIPMRVLERRECLAKNHAGDTVVCPAVPKMFPVPSYASLALREEVGIWLGALAEVVLPLCDPDGPVVLLELDSHSALFGRHGALESDFHPDAVAAFRERTGLAPPTPGGDLRTLLSWMCEREERVQESLEGFARAFAEDALVPWARTLPPDRTAPDRLDDLVGPTLAGRAVYGGQQALRDFLRQTEPLVASTTLPFAAELACGGPPWFPTMSEDDQRATAFAALGSGIRAFQLFMAVGRERWYGDARASWASELVQMAHSLKLHTLRRRFDLAVVVSRAEARVAEATSALAGAPPALSSLLFGAGLSTDADARKHATLMRRLEDAARLADLSIAWVDERCLHAIPAAVHAVLLPTTRRVDAGAWGALHALAAAGMPVVVGPVLPIEDERGEPLGEASALFPGAGLLSETVCSDPEALAEALLSLVPEGDDDWICPEAPGVFISVHVDEAARPRALFLVETEGQNVEVAINAPANTLLTDPLREETRQEAEGVVRIDLSPYQVRAFAIGGRDAG